MKKEKTELLKLLEHQCFYDYVEDEETNGLREIAEYHLPEYLVKNSKIFMSLIYAFMYGAIMGIRHEKKRRRTDNGKNRIKEIIDKIQREDARYSSINMLCQIQREDVQNYLNIIIKDVYEEVCPNE